MINIKDIRNSKVVKSQLEHSLSQVTIDGMYLEFGVAEGLSINRIAKYIQPDLVHGFDSFEGLPEEWVQSDTQTVKAGFFSRNGQLPTVMENVRLYKGLFKDALPIFLEKNNKNIAFLNMDCDIYSSTIYALTTLNNFIIPGTIIRFDELSDWGLPESYANWAEHEYKALNEWLANFGRLVEPVSRDNKCRASIRVIK